jgi:hypothetical protein
MPGSRERSRRSYLNLEQRKSRARKGTMNRSARRTKMSRLRRRTVEHVVLGALLATFSTNQNRQLSAESSGSPTTTRVRSESQDQVHVTQGDILKQLEMTIQTPEKASEVEREKALTVPRLRGRKYQKFPAVAPREKDPRPQTPQLKCKACEAWEGWEAYGNRTEEFASALDQVRWRHVRHHRRGSIEYSTYRPPTCHDGVSGMSTTRIYGIHPFV